jgi:uncharacterized protein (DUF433 family)
MPTPPRRRRTQRLHSSGLAHRQAQPIPRALLLAQASQTTEISVEIRQLDRITLDPAVMGGKPCIRDMRVTVGMIVGMIASGHDRGEVLGLYPYLEAEDIAQALSYAARRSERARTLPLS